MLTPDGRVTVSGQLLIETTGDARSEQRLETDAEILEVYRRRFGIELTRVPTIP
jgi:N-hydroxyarylamine O-acetyltransferase